MSGTERPLNVTVLVEALQEILEIAQEQYDTVDRRDGTPGPNQWMQIGTLIEAALAKAEGKLPW